MLMTAVCPSIGVGVMVGVGETVGVAVAVAVAEGGAVPVGCGVAVLVAVAVGVSVGTAAAGVPASLGAWVDSAPTSPVGVGEDNPGGGPAKAPLVRVEAEFTATEEVAEAAAAAVDVAEGSATGLSEAAAPVSACEAVVARS